MLAAATFASVRSGEPDGLASAERALLVGRRRCSIPPARGPNREDRVPPTGSGCTCPAAGRSPRPADGAIYLALRGAQRRRRDRRAARLALPSRHARPRREPRRRGAHAPARLHPRLTRDLYVPPRADHRLLAGQRSVTLGRRSSSRRAPRSRAPHARTSSCSTATTRAASA